jgi:hypothetical protein
MADKCALFQKEEAEIVEPDPPTVELLMGEDSDTEDAKDEEAQPLCDKNKHKRASPEPDVADHDPISAIDALMQVKKSDQLLELEKLVRAFDVAKLEETEERLRTLLERSCSRPPSRCYGYDAVIHRMIVALPHRELQGLVIHAAASGKDWVLQALRIAHTGFDAELLAVVLHDVLSNLCCCKPVREAQEQPSVNDMWQYLAGPMDGRLISSEKDSKGKCWSARTLVDLMRLGRENKAFSGSLTSRLM